MSLLTRRRVPFSAVEWKALGLSDKHVGHFSFLWRLPSCLDCLPPLVRMETHRESLSFLQKYIKVAEDEKQRYAREYKSTYGEEAPFLTKAAAQANA